MRIEAFSALVAVVWLTAVLCMRLVAASSNQTLNFSSRKPRDHHLGEQFSRWSMPLEESTTRRMTYPEMQSLIRQEGGEEGLPVDCCPTIEEMVEPQGGRNREDMFVELYRDGENAQRFFEYSCRPDVLDKPCRFIDRKLQAQSRCVQKFSYTYAIVKNPTSKEEGEQPAHVRHHRRQEQHHFPAFPGSSSAGTSSWTLDYIKVRSGCSCEVTPKPRKKKLAAMKVKRTRTSRARSRLHLNPNSSIFSSSSVADQSNSSAEV
ncbi:uncharacterized protein LOC107980723 [Nasonia vitripennis]|uniref:Spaetzle domain-containing protein n=1 Tax=Nasonia vitripennis TaxID=7425 RepID=A0A7M7IMR9_NASVI|nr:uncharacterized protein LOC107980723 [Nasonia vitripennis]XP_016838316.1 uncharacterized protein LOC107980723 [Nasonia vitripennis]